MYEEGPTHYDVQFYDEWLEVDDFVTLEAEDEDDARETFLNEYVEEGDEDRYDIQEIEYAYTSITITR